MERMLATKRMSINTSFHNLTWRNQVKLEVFTGSSGGVAVTDNSKQPGSIASSPQLLLTVPTPPWRGPYLGTMSLKPFSFSGNILCISKRPNIASSLCTNSLFSCPSSFSSSILYKWDNVELYSKVSLTASSFV